jgi:hypothetical protein
VHLLPEAKIPYELPIDTFIKNHESNERKIERRNLKVNEKITDPDRHELEMNAKA